MLRKWAYWFGYIEVDAMIDEVKSMGDKGWELCHMSDDAIWHHPTSGKRGFYFIFKRPGDVINEVDRGRI